MTSVSCPPTSMCERPRLNYGLVNMNAVLKEIYSATSIASMANVRSFTISRRDFYKKVTV